MTTAQKFLLLAQHPEKGRLRIPEIFLNFGIVGAIMLEMSLKEGVVLENGRLHIKEGIVFNTPIQNELGAIIAKSRKPRKIKIWISKFNRRAQKYKWQILEEMERDGIIRIEKKKFLGLIPYKKTFLVDKAKQDALIKEVNAKILHDKNIGQDDFVLFGLIEACKMHNIVSLEKSERKAIRKLLKQIIKEIPIAQGVSASIQEMQVAMMSVMMFSSISASSSHH